MAVHRVVWVLLALLGLAVVPLGLLPGFTVTARVYLGSGADQHRASVVRRTFVLLGDATGGWYVAVLALAAVVVLAALAGLARPGRWEPLLVVVLAGLAAPALMSQEYLGSSRLVMWKRGIDEVRRTAEAEYDGQSSVVGVSVDAGPGWHATLTVFLVLVAVAAVALGRRLDLPFWIPAPVLLAGIVLVFAGPAPDCGGAGTPRAGATDGPYGVLGAGLCAALLPLGIGLLANTRAGRLNRYLGGGLCVGLGPLAAFVDLFLLAARNCAFY